MSFLAVTIPVSLLLGAILLGLVIWEVRRGAFDDWDGPSERLVADDDAIPERESDSNAPG